MDDSTTVKELKALIKGFCEAREWDQYHNPKDLAVGIITESAELLEIFRFKTDKEIEEMFKSEKTKEKITDEMADILYFLLRLAQLYDVDLAEALKKKMRKNAKKYPVEKAKGSNKKYTEL